MDSGLDSDDFNARVAEAVSRELEKRNAVPQARMDGFHALWSTAQSEIAELKKCTVDMRREFLQQQQTTRPGFSDGLGDLIVGEGFALPCERADFGLNEQVSVSTTK